MDARISRAVIDTLGVESMGWGDGGTGGTGGLEGIDWFENMGAYFRSAA